MRRSDPFNELDWRRVMNSLDYPDGWIPLFKDADLDWLIRRYPHLEADLRAVDLVHNGRFTPTTVQNINPIQPIKPAAALEELSQTLEQTTELELGKDKVKLMFRNVPNWLTLTVILIVLIWLAYVIKA